MRVRCTGLLFLIGSSLIGQTTPASQMSEGVRPKAQASEYAAQAHNNRATLAASVLPPEQVKQRFAYDISKTYLVFEVAFYPGTEGPVALSPRDFSLHLSKRSDVVDPADAATVAAKMQVQHAPGAYGQSTPVYTEASVGYEHGTDPYTGRRVNNVYTGVGVGIGGPPLAPYPGRQPIDQQLLEEQLWHRSFPEGSLTKPVAGYLYFPLALIKKEKAQYLIKVLGDGQDKWELQVPLVKH